MSQRRIELHEARTRRPPPCFMSTHTSVTSDYLPGTRGRRTLPVTSASIRHTQANISVKDVIWNLSDTTICV